MCGLFGVARPGDAKESVAEALFMLGLMAEERGTDAAGLALWVPGRTGTGRQRRDLARFGDVRVGPWRVVKRAGAFRLLQQPGLAEDLSVARLVLGHTRWATQGDRRRLVNASPLAVGRVIGTHNGDIDAARLRAVAGPMAPPVGETDSEPLFAAVAVVGGDPAALLRVLGDVRGRAALVWVDRGRPQRLWLARAALSPLAVGVTSQGSVFWASNPAWLRRLGQHCRLRWRRVFMLQEGTLLALDVGREAVRFAGQWSFTPVARRRDVRLPESVVWRGFSRADQATDQAGLRHRVEPLLLPADWWDTAQLRAA